MTIKYRVVFWGFLGFGFVLTLLYIKECEHVEQVLRAFKPSLCRWEDSEALKGDGTWPGSHSRKEQTGASSPASFSSSLSPLLPAKGVSTIKSIPQKLIFLT